MQLPTEVELRHCQRDNFLFLAGGRQCDYDEYYTALANDSVHQEVSAGAIRSPISKLQSDHLAAALDGFFTAPRNVLDLGCGEGSLLIELAANFPSSTFFGFEPGPAARTAFANARMLGLENLSITSREDKEEDAKFVTYDLVIASHVVEHMLDFDLLHPVPGVHGGRRAAICGSPQCVEL